MVLLAQLDLNRAVGGQLYARCVRVSDLCLCDSFRRAWRVLTRRGAAVAISATVLVVQPAAAAGTVAAGADYVRVAYPRDARNEALCDGSTIAAPRRVR